MHTHQLVRIIDGLRHNNLSDLISSYDYEKFVILQDFNLDGEQIPARCKALNLFSDSIYSLFCSSNTYTQHRRETTSSSYCSQFLVYRIQRPLHLTTGSKTQCLFGEQVPESISRDDCEKSPGYRAISSKLFIFSA